MKSTKLSRKVEIFRPKTSFMNKSAAHSQTHAKKNYKIADRGREFELFFDSLAEPSK